MSDDHVAAPADLEDGACARRGAAAPGRAPVVHRSWPPGPLRAALREGATMGLGVLHGSPARAGGRCASSRVYHLTSSTFVVVGRVAPGRSLGSGGAEEAEHLVAEAGVRMEDSRPGARGGAARRPASSSTSSRRIGLLPATRPSPAEEAGQGPPTARRPTGWRYWRTRTMRPILRRRREGGDGFRGAARPRADAFTPPLLADVVEPRARIFPS